MSEIYAVCVEMIGVEIDLKLLFLVVQRFPLIIIA